MAYLAQWAVFIDGDDLDPIEVAAAARRRVDDHQNDTWRIVDLNGPHFIVVDLYDRRIIPMSGGDADAASGS